MVYKWCVVPQCTNTSLNNPQKLFVSVPTNPKRRKMWLNLARRDPNMVSSHLNVFMCEDHFDIEKDTMNYMKYKMGFSQKILLTDEAVPTRFHCQEDRRRRLCDPKPSREVFLKRQRLDLVTECLQSQNANETHAESIQIKENMIQEVIQPKELPKTQEKETITDPIITVEKSVQVTKVNMHYMHNMHIGARLCKQDGYIKVFVPHHLKFLRHLVSLHPLKLNNAVSNHPSQE